MPTYSKDFTTEFHSLQRIYRVPRPPVDTDKGAASGKEATHRKMASAAVTFSALRPSPARRRLHLSDPPLLQRLKLSARLPRFPSSSSPALFRRTHLTGGTGTTHFLFTPKASVGSVEYAVEPGTGVKFPKALRVPGSSSSLSLLGTGYREKVFAIIGVKVYAAGFYAESSIRESLSDWKGQTAAELSEDSSFFSSMFEAPVEKSLDIVLVRDVDGKTFWNALDDVISPRIKNPTGDDESSALSTFRRTFQQRELKKETCICLTWVRPSRMLISISSAGSPTAVDAEILSSNINLALFDGFFGKNPVSSTLKASVTDGLKMMMIS
ncbi:LOW QUALITY PROTEIN: fatty-acid-binding protein 3, chloroplastic [Curcuma longa]|uniref:LOW QUALITY PROTEIN: fatty-acid-binding protein 3, chloroplastic n=1 Tax=Curcuma longa TaxID=136217 RepID=UPI003D9EAC88